MYQALYRKWRPQTFDEVIGQKHITETLKNQVRTGRLSHAYIFIGTRGTGKTTCARILAKAVNCEHPVNGNPCGKCSACLGVSDGSIMDVVEMDAASNNGVDNVRALREEAIYSPSTLKKRVYIIDEVHMLSKPAFNALLKILEEPPEHLMFILATTELNKVPATILSRCQRHCFHRLETGEIAKYLEHVAECEKFYLTHDASDLIARLAEGGLRDAMSILDQCSANEHIDVDSVYDTMGLAGNRHTEKMLGLILAHDSENALKDFSSIWMGGKDPGTFLRELSGLLRDVMITKVAPKSGGNLTTGGFDRAVLSSFGSKLTVEELISAMETIQRSLVSLRDSSNPRTAAELCLLSLCSSTAGDSIDSLRARISRLEEEISKMDSSAVRVYPGTRVRNEQEYELHDEYDDRLPQDEGEFHIFEEQEPDITPVQPEKPVCEPEAAMPQPENNAPANVEPANTGVSWDEICSAAADRLPMDIKMILSDRKKICGSLSGGVLEVRAAEGFIYTRVNRQEILAGFARAAQQLSGHPVRAVAAKLEEQSSSRSLDELKSYPEVKFI